MLDTSAQLQWVSAASSTPSLLQIITIFKFDHHVQNLYYTYLYLYYLVLCLPYKEITNTNRTTKDHQEPLISRSFSKTFQPGRSFSCQWRKIAIYDVMTSQMTPHLRESAKWPFYLIIELLWTPCCSHTTAHFYGSQWKKVVNFSSYFRSYKTHRCTHNHVHEHILRTMYVVFRHTHTYCKSLINLWSS